MWKNVSTLALCLPICVANGTYTTTLITRCGYNTQQLENGDLQQYQTPIIAYITEIFSMLCIQGLKWRLKNNLSPDVTKLSVIRSTIDRFSSFCESNGLVLVTENYIFVDQDFGNFSKHRDMCEINIPNYKHHFNIYIYIYICCFILLFFF